MGGNLTSFGGKQFFTVLAGHGVGERKKEIQELKITQTTMTMRVKRRVESFLYIRG